MKPDTMAQTQKQSGFHPSGRRSRGAGPPPSPSDVSSPAYNRKRGRKGEGLKTDGGVSDPTSMSWAPSLEQQGKQQSQLQQPKNSRSKVQHSKNAPLCAPGRKRPRAGRPDAHPSCQRATEKMVQACTGQGPFEGLARRALDCGHDHTRPQGLRRSNRVAGKGTFFFSFLRGRGRGIRGCL